MKKTELNEKMLQRVEEIKLATYKYLQALLEVDDKEMEALGLWNDNILQKLSGYTMSILSRILYAVLIFLKSIRFRTFVHLQNANAKSVYVRMNLCTRNGCVLMYRNSWKEPVFPFRAWKKAEFPSKKMVQMIHF